MNTQENSPVAITPIEHASLVMHWNSATIYVDPVGDASLYAAHPKPDIILVTHEHGDHYNPDTLDALASDSTVLVVNERVAGMLPGGMKKNLVVMKNGDMQAVGPLSVSAVPAYNIRPEAQQFHPQGRDNGYVLEKDGFRIYVAGDTEGTPEMRALKDIDVAFLPMNLPYTMSIEDAADAVLAFKPKQVYPYHYRGQNGLSDVSAFKELVAKGDPAVRVELAQWYPEQ
jgi:L-ascorbate metabolism protein UlaG (beta-lactamase superfamily)